MGELQLGEQLHLLDRYTDEHQENNGIIAQTATIRLLTIMIPPFVMVSV